MARYPLLSRRALTVMQGGSDQQHRLWLGSVVREVARIESPPAAVQHLGEALRRLMPFGTGLSSFQVSLGRIRGETVGEATLHGFSGTFAATVRIVAVQAAQGAALDKLLVSVQGARFVLSIPAQATAPKIDFFVGGFLERLASLYDTR